MCITRGSDQVLKFHTDSIKLFMAYKFHKKIYLFLILLILSYQKLKRQ